MNKELGPNGQLVREMEQVRLSPSPLSCHCTGVYLESRRLLLRFPY